MREASRKDGRESHSLSIMKLRTSSAHSGGMPDVLSQRQGDGKVRMKGGVKCRMR